MLLSTAIPIVIAAIVIVIISKGIPNKPIIPKIKKAAIKFGTTPINDKVMFLNNINNIICDQPKGAFYVFPDISYFLNKTYKGQLINTANDLSMLLLNEKFIVTVSGDSFGSPNNIRFSYATSDEIIHKMLERLEAVLSLIK